MPQAMRLAVGELLAEIATRLHQLPDRQTANLRCLRREFSKRLARAEPRMLVDLAWQLLDQPGIEYRFLSYELVSHHRAALASIRSKELLRFGRGMSSWGEVDMFACYLAGPAWRQRQVPDALIHRWARSDDRWWRRAALVSTVPLNSKARGGRGDSLRTLEVCRALLGDRDDMMVKAMSWALRELAKRDAEAVGSFLAEHQSALAARVLREVRHKLTTGLKNPRKNKS